MRASPAAAILNDETDLMSVIRAGSAFLQERGIEEAFLEASVLLRFLLGMSDRAELFVEPERRLTRKQREDFFRLLTERIGGKPLAYIVGEKEFYGLPFYVNESVMVPRPVTEHLVEAVLDWLKRRKKSRLDILDVGTGSGCIAVAVAVADGRVRVLATDVSPKALSVAKSNIKRHKVGARVRLLCTSLFDGLGSDARFDCIVSNPPYVTDAEFETVSRDVRSEPSVALRGGADGLDFYRLIVVSAPHFLRDGGLLALELNPALTDDVKELARRSGLSNIRVLPDYYGLPRVLLAEGVRGVNPS